MLAAIAQDNATERKVDVHLFGGDISDGAPLAVWYRSIGITNVWLYTLKGAFPQDQKAETQRTVAELKKGRVLEAYRSNQIRYWWFERPVPDYLYATAGGSSVTPRDIWDDSAETNAIWDEICRKVAEIYPGVREAKFEGLVYDNEAYYSFKGDESGKDKPWVWGGHTEEYGVEGNYYRRGRQVGEAIQRAWPGARVIHVYAFGYEGERWWYQGFKDAGLDVYLGDEHTYGAGPKEGDEPYYKCWWLGKKTKACCDWKRGKFPFVADNQHVMAGLFPIDFGAKKPNYAARFFREQLESAANDDPSGPIPVWIWPQGAFTPESWQSVEYDAGESAEDYLSALREFSAAFGGVK